MICCDTCPYFPTCEEVDDFKRDVLGLDEYGQPVDDLDGQAGEVVDGLDLDDFGAHK